MYADRCRFMISSTGHPSRRCEQRKIGNIIFKKTKNELEIVNTANRQRLTLHLSTQSSLKTANTDQFPFPTDAAIVIATDKITLPTVVPIHIRDEHGTNLGEMEHTAYKELHPDTYYLELSGPIQLYIHVRGALTLSSNLSQTYIDFSTNTEVTIGACSNCDQPATSITTTDDPKDMMAAVSTFGSALKTIKPERSYPSYRGHPPTIERGDDLQIPATLSPPDTGLQIKIPPTCQSIYIAAPLSYYLGAQLVSGADPRLVADTGFEYQLGTEHGFEAGVEKVLKHIFFMDCLVRGEGEYSIDLHERRVVKPHLDLDFATLYNQPLAEQVEAYLEVPFPVIKGHIPKWKLTIHMEAAPASVEMLPFAVNELAIVRIPQQSHASYDLVEDKKLAVEDFLRNTAPIRGTQAKEINTKYVQVERSDSLEQMWVGDGVPVNANKAVSAAYQNRLHRLSSDDSIKIIVVCNDIPSTNTANDVEMNAEREIIDDVYGSRADLPFDVTILHDLTMAELRTVLATSADFLHYIGHIDDEGINCTDGKLDVRTTDEIGTDAFLLNACKSRNQGEALIERGSIGGIVTLSNVINTGAIRMGQTLARLLNGGFPLRAALEIASNDTSFGDQYIVVGDGGLAIAQAESGTPNLCKIRATDDQFEVEIEAYPTSQLGMGAAFIPYIKSNKEYYLNSGNIGRFELSEDEFQSFLSLENIPVETEEGLQWSYELDISSL